MRWIWSRLTGMWQVIFAPGTVFAQNQTGPSYLIPLLILSLISITLLFIQSPIHLEWLQSQMSSAGAPDAQMTNGVDLAKRSIRIGVFITPLFLLLRWLAHAALIWLTAQLLLVQIGFSQTLTVVAYSYLPIALRDGVICLVLCLRDPEVLHQAEGLNVALGLNLVFPKIPPPWWALAANINLFEVWFVALLAIGIAALSKSRWQRALVVVMPVWLFMTLLQFGFVSLGYQLKGQFMRG